MHAALLAFKWTGDVLKFILFIFFSFFWGGASDGSSDGGDIGFVGDGWSPSDEGESAASHHRQVKSYIVRRQSNKKKKKVDSDSKNVQVGTRLE